jgi:DNA-binding response OmpR family regulator
MSRSLLIADDSNTIRKVVELTFRDTDFVVDCASDGDQAARELESGRHDVVLADVVMPGANGYELCRRIKTSSRPVPVLLLAGTFEPFDHDQARECGADGCLLKPFDSETLLERVSSLLAERAALRTSAVEVREADMEEPVSVAIEEVLGEVEREAETVETAAEPPAARIQEAQIQQIVEAVTGQLRASLSRELAEEIVPRAAETAVREYLRQFDASSDE